MKHTVPKHPFPDLEDATSTAEHQVKYETVFPFLLNTNQTNPGLQGQPKFITGYPVKVNSYYNAAIESEDENLPKQYQRKRSVGESDSKMKTSADCEWINLKKRHRSLVTEKNKSGPDAQDNYYYKTKAKEIHYLTYPAAYS